MKKIVFLLFIISFMFTFSANAKVKKSKPGFKLPHSLAKEIMNWPKNKLQYFSAVYFELGKRFYALKRMTDSQACFLYTIQIYPLGKPAAEAKKFLKQYWKISIP